MLMRRFDGVRETSASALLERELPLPAVRLVLKCAHAFNLLDARGAIWSPSARVHRPRPQPRASRRASCTSSTAAAEEEASVA